jgi:predicted Zn-dependent protease with MMP-like domain
MDNPVHIERRLWLRLRLAADQEVGALLAALPPQVRQQVAGIPVVFEPAPSPALVKDGIDPDLLGLFVGAAFDETCNDPVPPEILLFLNNLWEEAGHDSGEYRREVRRTLLHEIGHYLGWDEDELAERDLE